MTTLRTIVDRAVLLTRRDASKTYVRSAPNAQATVDIFKGEWASRLPPPLDGVRAGSAPLFEDDRIRWAAERIGGLAGRSVLDLGPLEGGHPYMFEQAGARDVLGIEGNPRAFLRCLVTRELLGLRRVSYRCGDFMEYLRQPHPRVDVINASGVLYHQQNPAELLALACRTADAVILWTHYYDAQAIGKLRRANVRFPTVSDLTYDGFAYRGYRHEYMHSVRMRGFCGAGTSSSVWMERAAILDCLRFFGMTKIDISSEDTTHANGPSFNLVASR